ncbi:MAG: hypothetical protein GX557_14990 [Chloroflexi bacterium]|nr:hypothetical protein [Chloroflexota bacterium]
MLILNEENQPLDRVSPFLWARVEHERMSTIVRLLGKLIAYLPMSGRSYYAWGLVITFRPAQRISLDQFSPSHLRLILGGRWEAGFVLGSWLLGLELGQPLVWLRRLQAA